MASLPHTFSKCILLFVLFFFLHKPYKYSEVQYAYLNPFSSDKEWYVCRTAYNSFTKNLAIIGGPEEKERGRKLLEKITIIPDNVSEEVAQLKCSSKIKPRTKVSKLL